jgi:hypothetical protein
VTNLAVDRVSLLELDVDTRLADLWTRANGETNWSLELVAPYLRAAFARGYVEATRGDRSLFTEYGFQVPPRRR